MTHQLFKLPKNTQIDSSVRVTPGAKAYFFATLTSTPQDTYTTSARNVAHAHPVVADGNGVFPPIYLDPALQYKLTLNTSADALIYTVDPVNDQVLGQDSIGQALFPQNDAEEAAAVTPVVFSINRYKDVPLERYGFDISGSPNLNSNTTAFRNAVSVCAALGNTGGVLILPEGNLQINDTIDFGTNAVNVLGSGKAQTFLNGVGFTADKPIFKYSGLTGARIDGVFCKNFAFYSANNLARGITSSWCINSDFSDLYFYQNYRGWVAENSFGNLFQNNNSYSITNDLYQLGIACNNNKFSKTRCVGNVGINVVSDCAGLSVLGCDFEGIIGNGAAILLFPSAGRSINGVNIEGNYFENIDGTAIYASGTDANSIRGLNIRGNYITGGYVDHPTKTFAVNAILLHQVTGFSIESNRIDDWETNAFFLDGTESNGYVRNNSCARVVNLSNTAFQRSVDVANNGAFGPQASYTSRVRVTVTYSASMAIDSTAGEFFDITPNNGTAFTINNPTGGFDTKSITFKIRNTTGGALGAATWASTFKMAAWTQPATGFSRSITFVYDGTNWVESGRTPADVAN
jgi:hypothetical protein